MVYFQSFLDLSWGIILLQLAWYDFYYQILPFKLLFLLIMMTSVNLMLYTDYPEESIFFTALAYVSIKALAKIYTGIHQKQGIGQGDLILYPLLLQWVSPVQWSMLLLMVISMILSKHLVYSASKKTHRPSKISLGSYLIVSTLFMKMRSALDLTSIVFLRQYLSTVL